MLRIWVFVVLQLLVSGYAFWRGGAPERVVGGLMIAALFATAAISYLTRADFAQIVMWLFLVDALFFLGMCVVAATADRYWPLWIAALQFDALAIHMVRAYDPGLIPFVYAWSSGQIAYPMLLILAGGTLRHEQRKQRHGSEPGWTWHWRDQADARG